MIIVEFFCGSKSLSKEAEKQGHKVFTIDILQKFNPDLCMDILNFKIDMLPKEFKRPDFIWFSPPCTKYSHANRKGKWDLTHSNDMVKKSLSLIEEFKKINPDVFYVLENPQTGTLKNQEFMQNIPFEDASYCKYGLPYRKQTRFWNNFDLKLKTCKKDCGFMDGNRHINSVGNGRKKYAKFQRYSWDVKLKYAIPKKLILSILKQVEVEQEARKSKHAIPPKPKVLGILANFI